VIINFKALSELKSVKILLKGWSRMWIEGGFRGASKKFMLNDGTMCHTMIRKGFIAIYCIPDNDNKTGRITHFLLKVSIENLSRFFSFTDAAEIYEIYCLLN